MSALNLRPVFAALLGIGVLSISSAALAQGNGNGNGGNPCFQGAGLGSLTPVLGPTGLFNINSGGTITITAPKSVQVTKNGTGITNWVLLGINAIGIVDANGNAIANVIQSGDTGTAVPSNGGPVNWNPCGTSFYEDSSQGNGYPATFGTNWIRTGLQSELDNYGLGSPNPSTPNQGIFQFSGLTGTFGTDYFIGIDFLAGNPTGSGIDATTTARMFFGPTGGTNGGGNGQSGSSGNGGEVPEPGEWAAMGVLSAGLMGLMARKRRRA